jgi:hypothetical protein
VSNQHTETCGCVVTIEPGHVYTKMCEQHKDEAFRYTRQDMINSLDDLIRTGFRGSTDNRDLIGG